MTLVDKAQEDLKKIIISKEFDETHYLPSEAELSKRLGVSRMTIREAVKSLEVRGFVKRIHGKGILIVDRSDKVVAQALSDMYEQNDVSLSDILDMRMVIEVPSAGLAAERATVDDIMKMEKCIEIMEKGYRNEDDYVQADLQFHLFLVEASKNKPLVSLTKSYQRYLYELVKKACTLLEYMESSTHFHRNILQSIKDRDPEKAKNYMQQHLTATKKVEEHIVKNS